MSGIYKLLFKKTSTYYLTGITLAFFFERTADLLAETIFKQINKGKLWDDIKKNYE